MHGLHRLLLMAVAALLAAAAVGVVLLWPSGDALPSIDAGVPPTLVEGTILDVAPYEREPEPFEGGSGEAAVFTVRLDSGPAAGSRVEVDTSLDGFPPLEAGDRVELTASDVGEDEPLWFIVDVVRGSSLLVLLGVFVVAVVAVSRWQGVRSLIALALSLLVVTRFVVPSILAGSQPFAVALVGSVLVLVVSLYLAHGVHLMATTALLGTAAALVLTVALGALFVDVTALTGYASEEATIARLTIDGLDVRGLVLAGLVISALGVLDDVTVTQASTVFALRAAVPEAGTRELVGRAMVVGRDHIASTVNTLVLAYAGASLALLLVFSTSGLPVADLLTSEVLAEEIVKTLVGSLGIVAAVPLTTLLAAWAATRVDGEELAAASSHGHVHG